MNTKRFWIIAAVIVLMAGVCFLWMRPSLPMINVFPQHPVVFARVIAPYTHIQKFLDSDLGKSIAAMDMSDILNRNHVSKQRISAYQRWQKDWLKIARNPLTEKLLEKEAVMAVYHQHNSYQFFVALRLTVVMQILETLSGWTKGWSEDIQITQQIYEGIAIHHLVLKKQNFKCMYLRLQDIVIMAPEGGGSLEEFLRVYRHQESALAEDSLFERLHNHAYPLEDADIFFNLNRNTFLHQKIGLSISGAYLLSCRLGQKAQCMMIADTLALEAHQTLDFEALRNDTWKLVPENALVYHWGAWSDAGHRWGVFKKALSRNSAVFQQMRLLKRKIERYFHINISKDVLPLFGREIGGYLTDIDMQGKYPFPRFLVFAKIHNRLQAEALINKLTVPVAKLLHQEEYHQVNIRYITLPLGANIDLGYCFVGDYGLVATSRQLLKKSIDTYSDPTRAIAFQEGVEKFHLSDGAKENAVTVMQPKELSRRAQDVLAWIDKYLSNQVSMAAAYQQDGESKKEELDQRMMDKRSELLLAVRKLTQLKQTATTNLSADDAALLSGAIENLSRAQASIREDILNDNRQKIQLARVLRQYAKEAQLAKLTMYNMENIAMPVLKSLEALEPLALRARIEDKMLEMELLTA